MSNPPVPRARRGTAAAIVLLLGGLLAMLVGGGALLGTWYAGRSWAASDEAGRAARELAAEPPTWIDDPAAQAASPAATVESPSAVAAPPAAVAPADPTQRPVSVVAEAPAVQAADTPPGTASAPAAPPRAPTDAIELVDSDFRFIDPPEPGARARITVTVRNHSDLPSAPLQLILSTPWLEGWKVIEADPPVLDDREQPEHRRVFVYPSLAANAQRTLMLGLVATDDAVDPPDLHLALDGGPEIAQVQPKTVAPRPRPGPARTLEIPSLNLRTTVVPVVWEPPAWVVGQIQASANVSEGNTVLIGHLTGLVGNVFGNLDRLKPGDEIIATSRGLDYHFVVSEMVVLPGSQSLPTQPADEPRLTLMTCSGIWDPIRRDYSHRLWVIAEPRELAESTLAGEPGPLERQFGPSVIASLQPPPPEEATAPPKEATAPPEEAEAAETPTEPAQLAKGAPPVGAPPEDAPPEDAPPEDAPPLAVFRPEPAPSPTVPPSVVIAVPSDGADVGPRVKVRGSRTEQANPKDSLWLAVRANVEGSHWYVYGTPLGVKADGTWEAELELGGGPGIRHTIVVAPVDPATDDRLRRFVAEHPGQPLPDDLPDAFTGAAQVTIRRR